MPSFKERKQWLLVFYSPRQSEGRPEEESLFTFKLLRQCYWPGTRAWKRRECVCAVLLFQGPKEVCHRLKVFRELLEYCSRERQRGGLLNSSFCILSLPLTSQFSTVGQRGSL